MKPAFDLRKYSRFSLQMPFAFSKNSSIGCGGQATVAFYPKDVVELTALIQQLTQDGTRYCVLGNLTNVLPPDGVVDFAVVCMKGLNGIVVGEGVFVQAGVTSGALLRACKAAKRGGAEFLSGIPCTLGGALYMNAGAGDKYISEIVESVTVLREGKRRILSLKDCEYAYKHSVFMENGDIILGATLRFEKATEEEIAKNEEYYLSKRLHLPKGKSMGCVFKNPPSAFAGDLIERSGLKGFRIGGAKISEEHANFIINDRNALSSDVKALIAVAKNAVRSQYGVRLEEEIRYLE